MKIFITLLLLILAEIVLINLGLWQVQRLEWKNNIIADIEAQENTDATNTSIDLNSAQPFQRGTIDGFLSGATPVIITPRTHDGDVGGHVILPFMVDNGPPVLVNLGWVADNEATQIPDLTPRRLTGHFREIEDKGHFTPANRPQQNLWHSINLSQLQSYFDVNQDFYPLVFYVEQPAIGNIIPFDGLPMPRNKHQQYAIFWFFMAGLLPLLVGLFIVRHRQKT